MGGDGGDGGDGGGNPDDFSFNTTESGDESDTGGAKIEDIRFYVKELPSDASKHRGWLFQVRAAFYAMVPKPKDAEEYWGGLRGYEKEELTWDELRTTVPKGLRLLNSKLFF